MTVKEDTLFLNDLSFLVPLLRLTLNFYQPPMTFYIIIKPKIYNDCLLLEGNHGNNN